MTNKITIEVEFDFENALERSQAEPLAAAEELRGAFRGKRGVYRIMREAMATSCAFRRSRPLVPIDRDHLFRSIATSVARMREGAVGCLC